MQAPASRNLAIDVHGLTKRYGGRSVVNGISLQVETGRIVGFLGPNGSGKTTTIRMICGLLTPDAGQGTCLGMDIMADAVSIKREVGYMTQKFGLYDDLSIRENLDFDAPLWVTPAQAGRGRCIAETRPDRSTGATRGLTFRRMEAASGIGRVSYSHTALTAAG